MSNSNPAAGRSEATTTPSRTSTRALLYQSETTFVGFRTVECGTNPAFGPNVLCVNGSPIVVKGVNR
ncbi:unnamed protein product, partial [Amoebophrya sp. A25]|eukprot:GSA25T00005514001.1